MIRHMAIWCQYGCSCLWRRLSLFHVYVIYREILSVDGSLAERRGATLALIATPSRSVRPGPSGPPSSDASTARGWMRLKAAQAGKRGKGEPLGGADRGGTGSHLARPASGEIAYPAIAIWQ